MVILNKLRRGRETRDVAEPRDVADVVGAHDVSALYYYLLILLRAAF